MRLTDSLMPHRLPNKVGARNGCDEEREPIRQSIAARVNGLHEASSFTVRTVPNVTRKMGGMQDLRRPS